MKNLPTALQLWSVRDEIARDFAGTVAAIAKIGYTGVELAGYGNLDARGAKAALDAAGLAVASMHVPLAALRTEPERVLAEALMFGTRHLVVPWIPPELFTSAAVAEMFGAELNAFGARLRASGLRLSYHNHAHEMRRFDGRTAMDWLLGAAEPRNLAAEVDVYWVHAGGESPVKFLRDHGARVPLVHLKDETELGSGPVDFAAIFAAMDEIGAAEWQIVEQEKYNFPPLESVRRCFAQLRAWGRA